MAAHSKYACGDAGRKTFILPAIAVTGLILSQVLPFRLSASAQPKATNHQPRDFYRSNSTRLMAEFLAELGRNGNHAIATHMPNPDLLDYFREIKQPLNSRRRIILRTKRAYRLLVEGKNQEAAQQFRRVKEAVRANPRLFERRFLHAVQESLAIAYLRAGEEANHMGQRQADSCVLLLSDGSASYRLQHWSRAAIKEYLEILRDTPDDLTSRWLLNIAYMNVNEYPDKVPAAWLIPPVVFRSGPQIKRFMDVAPKLGLDFVGRAGGCITEDFNGDGYLDIMVSSAGLNKKLDQLRYFQNNGNGTFTDRTGASGLTGITGGLNISSADYNNDGYVDVFIPRGAWLGADGNHPPSLLRNNGDGTFTDVTAEASLFTLYPSHTAVWGDFDNDGFVDLFVGNETTPQDKEVNPCQLFHNNGDGTFTDVAGQVGLDVYGWVKGAAWGDFDNDGLPDLYISRLFETNLLYHNEGKQASGKWKFTDVSRKAGVTEPLDSFPCWFWDYDNDGWLDIFVSSCSAGDFTHVAGQVAADYLGQPFTAETPRLYRNNRDGTFTDVSREAGLQHALYTMGANFGDLDNDGWLDMYLGTGNPLYQGLMPNRMFRSNGGRDFQDVTMSGGFGHLQKGHGIAFADLDNDGDQDVFAVLGGVYPGDTHPRVLFENPGFGNHWLTLKLEGVRTNRAAIGARIKVSLKTGSGQRDIYSTVTTGGSFGASSFQQEIGLGQATAIDAVEITWPTTGRTQVFKNLKMDSTVKIREGDSTPTQVALKQFHLGAGADGGKQTRQSLISQRAKR
jgi:hypothetical protein